MPQRLLRERKRKGKERKGRERKERENRMTFRITQLGMFDRFVQCFLHEMPSLNLFSHSININILKN